ncbi:hypothetical protein HMPREF1502_3209 [Klebsiella sp. AS10]|uniref:Uncharacterized protein n=1 Tax=Klebsiella quasipneumoniae TaxID=1463165 RepID=A0A6B7PYB8_9ENTR|nr:hypothetical protein HMPREF1502_3209 [Klebsiella sp. AS10]QFX77846.1 hypothetical protein [Klebsiella quasipneumoniae]UVN19805.1 hypothetical protein [Klebsiella michiganensis]
MKLSPSNLYSLNHMYVRTPDEPEHAEGLSVRMRLTGIP